MNVTLRRRVCKLEGLPISNPLNGLPEEVIRRRLDLLLRIYVYIRTGRDAAAPRRELEAMGALRFPKREPPDETAIHNQALAALRAEPARADYRELLGMLQPCPAA